MEINAHIIYNPEVAESVQMARRALTSCLNLGTAAQMVKGVSKKNAQALAKESGLSIGFDYVETQLLRPMRDGQIGCLLAHRSVWQICADIKKPVIVLEHDVELVAPLVLPDFEHVLNLQRYVWDDALWPYHAKVQSLAHRSGRGNAKYFCLPGTCAYAITPTAARKLLSIKKMLPADLFVNKSVVTIDDHIGSFIVHNEFSTVAPRSVEF